MLTKKLQRLELPTRALRVDPLGAFPRPYAMSPNMETFRRHHLTKIQMSVSVPLNVTFKCEFIN